MLAKIKTHGTFNFRIFTATECYLKLQFDALTGGALRLN